MMTRAPLAAGTTAKISYDDPYDEGIFWSMGSRFKQAPIEPVQTLVKSGYGGLLPTLVLAPICLMSRALADVLICAGIDNLDLYRAEILDQNTGVVHHDHVAFNVVGVASVADMTKSSYSAHGGPMISVNFDHLVLGPRGARGALLFRLAQAVSGIVVHVSIKEAVEKAGIVGLQFLEPEDWIS